MVFHFLSNMPLRPNSKILKTFGLPLTLRFSRLAVLSRTQRLKFILIYTISTPPHLFWSHKIRSVGHIERGGRGRHVRNLWNYIYLWNRLLLYLKEGELYTRAQVVVPPPPYFNSDSILSKMQPALSLNLRVDGNKGNGFNHPCIVCRGIVPRFLLSGPLGDFNVRVGEKVTGKAFMLSYIPHRL